MFINYTIPFVCPTYYQYISLLYFPLLVSYLFRSPRALTFGYRCAIHVGVDVEAADSEADVFYLTFIMSAQYRGYLVLYKIRYNGTTGQLK